MTSNDYHKFRSRRAVATTPAALLGQIDSASSEIVQQHIMFEASSF